MWKRPRSDISRRVLFYISICACWSFEANPQKLVSCLIRTLKFIATCNRPAPALAWAARLLSGVLFLASLIILIGGFNINLPPFFADACWGLSLLYCGILLRYAPADHWFDNPILIISHPIYWMMTVAALYNAAKRVAFGQLDWLKSNHQPYAVAIRSDGGAPYQGSAG